MKLHKDSYFLAAWIIIGISFFVFVFLALLNNRYMYLNSTTVLDKWSGRCSMFKQKDSPKPEKIIENPIDKNNP
jgi:hypothetical protein